MLNRSVAGYVSYETYPVFTTLGGGLSYTQLIFLGSLFVTTLHYDIMLNLQNNDSKNMG